MGPGPQVGPGRRVLGLAAAGRDRDRDRLRVDGVSLRDLPTLEVFIDPAVGPPMFANVMRALSFAANRDFLLTLRDRKKDEITVDMEAAAAAAALAWWRHYLAAHPDGDDRAAVRDGFLGAGYRIGSELDTPDTRKELRRALGAGNDVVRYNAYRRLNRLFDTHFDLERVFAPDKYGGFLAWVDQERRDEARLRKYREERLGGSSDRSR